jgi:hypothetical protein
MDDDVAEETRLCNEARELLIRAFKIKPGQDFMLVVRPHTVTLEDPRARNY